MGRAWDRRGQGRGGSIISTRMRGREVGRISYKKREDCIYSFLFSELCIFICQMHSPPSSLVLVLSNVVCTNLLPYLFYVSGFFSRAELFMDNTSVVDCLLHVRQGWI